MSKTPEDFIRDLTLAFTHGEIEFDLLQAISEKEQQYELSVHQYQGYIALSKSYKCFFQETVNLTTPRTVSENESTSAGYALFLPRLVHSFQSLCGAEHVAFRGYPLHGYVLLRNTFDSLVSSSAALQKLATFYDIAGIVPGKTLDEKSMRNLRIKTEQSICDKMTGKDSNLSEKTIKLLSRWDDMFDLETHGAQLSLLQAKDWMRGKVPLQVLPQFNETMFAMFMNRWCEVAWMAHRLIPLIQPPDVSFPEVWKSKWKLLDDSFSMCVESLTKQLGKEIGAAIVEFVEAKFPFSAYSVFPL